MDLNKHLYNGIRNLEEIRKFGFKSSKVDNCVFAKVTIEYKVVITLYVDNLLLFGSNIQRVEETKKFLNQTFDIKDLGLVDVILGVKVLKSDETYILTQSNYIENILRKFNYFDVKLVSVLLILT